MLSCQQFKAAFLQQCAQAGLTADDTLSLVQGAREKLAESREKAGAGLSGWGLGTFLGSAAGLGGLGGYGLAKLESLNDEDPTEIQTREKIVAYRQAVQRALVQQRLRQQREGVRPRRPMLS